MTETEGHRQLYLFESTPHTKAGSAELSYVTDGEEDLESQEKFFHFAGRLAVVPEDLASNHG